MNNIFNLNRFGRLLIKHSIEHYKSYMMSLIVLIGVMLLGGSFIIYVTDTPLELRMQMPLFLAVLLLAGTIFTSTVFADIGDKKKSTAALTLPASHFEKFLVAWLYSFVLFLVTYIVCFYLILLFLVNVKHFQGQQAEIVNIFYKDAKFPICVLLYAFMHSIAFCGAIYFEKLHFIKTAFIFFIGLAILIAVNQIILHLTLGRDTMIDMPFTPVRLMENNKIEDINIIIGRQNYMVCFIAILALTFWTAAYYRLKEKQV